MEKISKEVQLLENSSSKLMSLALKAGAESAEVCSSYGVSTKISLEKQDFQMASADDGYSLGLRVLVGARQGFASCNSTDPKELKETASRAVEIAKFSPENPFYAIARSENVAKEAPSDLWDDGLFSLSLQTQKDWTKLMADEATKDARFRLNEGGFSLSGGAFLVINSQGTHKIQLETSAVWSLMGMAVEGQNITSFDYFQGLARKAGGVPDRIRATTKQFRDHMVQNLKHGASQSYKGLVVFTPRAVSDVFLGAIVYHLNGRNVAEGTARWTLESKGQKVLADEISVRDNPWFSDRFGCTLFDREGTPTENRTLIQNGVVKEFLLDQYAAKALGKASTGHAVGGPSALPSVGSHTLCVAGGKEPLADVMLRAANEQKDFLLVHRFSGQVDPVTGDFSGVAKGGEWWHAGERAYFVKETLISGNVFEALTKGIFGISKETQVVECQTESPTLVLSDLSVTGSGT